MTPIYSIKCVLFSLIVLLLYGCEYKEIFTIEAQGSKTKDFTLYSTIPDTLTLTIGSFNILGKSTDSIFPQNTWDSRKSAVKNIILQDNNYPDIFGVQEGRHIDQVLELADSLDESYSYYATEREVSARAVFWKTNQFTLIDTGEFDLLEGHYPSTQFWPQRYAIYVMLRHISTGKDIRLFHVHLPVYASNQLVRYIAVNELADIAKDISFNNNDEPIIILGDLNNYPNTVVDGVISAPMALNQAYFVDAFNAPMKENADYGTTNDIANALANTGVGGNRRIDYIFGYPNNKFYPLEYRNIINFKEGSSSELSTPVPSDHNPVWSKIQLNYNGRVVDIDGNSYETVSIGNQVWMKENLKTTRYRNGDTISTGLSAAAWSVVSHGAFTLFPYNETDSISSEQEMKETYGYLYNGYAVSDPRDITPQGWRIPTDDDWKELEMHVGMTQSEANATSWRGDVSYLLRNTIGWGGYNGTDHVGFSAVPGGVRDANGDYGYFAIRANFWTQTPSSTQPDRLLRRILHNTYVSINRTNISKNEGYSVRCIKIK